MDFSSSLVSIIVPVYNCEQYIEKCLNSILKQDYENLEIIVIDDGSTDGSGNIIKTLAKEDRRIQLLEQENMGVSVARNRGVQCATGKYITFVDGDDYIALDYIKAFVKAAEENEADLCVCGYTMVDRKGKELFKSIPKEPYIRNQHEEYPYRILATLARFYRIDLWRKYDICYEEKSFIRGEDIPVALLTNAVAKNIQCVEQSGYYYVQHEASARKSMRGLKTYQLPYQALEDCVAYVMQLENTNSKEFFELGIFRILITFLFDLARGADKSEMDKLYRFETEMVRKYFSEYNNNRKMRLFSGLDIPFMQRLAVKIYVLIFRMGGLRLCTGIMRKVK